MDFLKYQLAKMEKDKAYQAYNYAGCALTLAQIRERAAEIQSQSEPMEGWTFGSPTVRNAILAAVHYVLTGRDDYS